MLGTKCPSITSRWIQSAPAASTARTSSPSLEKSEARIDGAMTRGRGVKELVMGAGSLDGRMIVSAGGRVCWLWLAYHAALKRANACGKFCRLRHLLPGAFDGMEAFGPLFHWVFCRGTALAESLAGVSGRVMRHLSEFR